MCADNLCDEVECGKGTCKASLEYKFNFICECDSGWKRTRGDNEDGLKYLPCVIPNCKHFCLSFQMEFSPLGSTADHDRLLSICLVFSGTLDYSCMTAPSPAPAVPHNESAFDRNHCYTTIIFKITEALARIPSNISFIWFCDFCSLLLDVLWRR